MRILREEGFANDGGIAAGAAGGVVHSFTGSTQECADYVSSPRRLWFVCSKLIHLTDGNGLLCWVGLLSQENLGGY